MAPRRRKPKGTKAQGDTERERQLDPELEALIDSLGLDDEYPEESPVYTSELERIQAEFPLARKAVRRSSGQRGYLKTIHLPLSGLGIIVFSPQNAKGLRKGQDHLDSYTRNIDEYVQRGTIVGFNTGEDHFLLNVFVGSAPNVKSVARLDLPLLVKGREVCFADVYRLMKWKPTTRPEETVEVDDGIYAMRLLAHRRYGNCRVLSVYLTPSPKLMRVRTRGVPILLDG